MAVVMELLLIMNPVAGKRVLRQMEKEIRAIFSKAGYRVSVLYTEADMPLAQQLKKHGGKPDLIVCAGGDGTLNQTISGMLELDLQVPVGYIPAGSTNDFASSLKLPKKLPEAAEHIVDSSVHALDIGCMKPEHYFIYVAAFGAFTTASYAASQPMKNKFGHFAYVLEGMKELPHIKPYHVRVTTENEVFEDNYIFGAVCNTRSIGGIIQLDPSQAQLDDGRFELFLIKNPKNFIELCQILLAIASRDFQHKAITFRHVESVSFQSGEELSWSLDGERGHKGMEANIKTLPNVLSFLY